RGSLRDLVLQRLGRADHAVMAPGFVREALADDVRRDAAFAPAFTGIAPLIAVQGLVTNQETGRRASNVQVYGVDSRFWRFHGLTAMDGPDNRTAWISPALGAEVGTNGTLLVRMQRPSAIPIESLHGRKDDLTATTRVTIGRTLGGTELGEFSLV